jgi:hypothetical protein
MKVIGTISLLVGALFIAIYAGAWIALIVEHGPAEAVRIGFTLWPGNIVQLVLLAFTLVFSIGGLLLLTSKK